VTEQDGKGGPAEVRTETELRIERQLTLLQRRVHHMHGTPDGVDLDRAGYGIMSRIEDSGPQRLSALAHAFGLDPSTITRQVQTLEGSGLLERSRDPLDRRASLLDLTATGREVLTSTRDLRLSRLREAMARWSSEEQVTFGRLLADFNEAVERSSLQNGQ